MTPDREPRRERFADGDDLALLGVGALAWLDRFADAVALRGDDERAPPEALVSAALGLLSMRRTLHRWAAQIDAAPPAPARAVDAPEGLLR